MLWVYAAILLLIIFVLLLIAPYFGIYGTINPVPNESNSSSSSSKGGQ